MKPKRVAFVFTHRIQYFVNLLDELHRRQAVCPLSICAYETARLADPGFGRRIKWDNRTSPECPEVVLSRQPRSLRRFRPVRGLGRALGDFSPDFVHLNGYSAAIQIQAWRWCRKHGVSYSLRGDGDCLRPESSWKTRLRRALTRPIVSGADAIFFQGEENRRYWERAGARDEQLVWIPCVSDSAVFRREVFGSDRERLVFRSSLGAEIGDMVLVVSGKLEARKRPGDALEALALLRERGRPVRLWFLGSGPLEEALRKRAAGLGVGDRVSFLGFRNQSEMPAILQAADALVHPSEADPWPYSVLDAAISGLPLALSDRTGSYPDWAAEPPAARVFPCGDVSALSKIIEDWLHDPASLHILGVVARAKAERHRESVFCEIFEQAADR